MKLLYIIFGLLVVSALAKPTDHLVRSIPGMGNFTDFDVYSGYLDIPSKDRFLHYILVESENDPVTDPLVIWFNGGPGCSSMLGFSQENGPFRMPDGDPTFYKNPHSWNQNASVLYIESPAGVGYSYFKNKDVDNFNDTTSSEDNYQALLRFYDLFPEFKDNELFISGESYAGVYVPYLAYQVLTNDNNINLQGVIIGNGATNWTYDCDSAFIRMGFWHSLYTFDLQERIEANHCTFKQFSKDTDECEALRSEFYSLISGVNPYDIYRECYYSNSTQDRLGKAQINGKWQTYKRGMTAQEYTPFAFKNGRNGGKIPTCIYGDGPTDFFNRQDVRDALHIDTDQPWELCTDRIVYDIGQAASYWIYPILKQHGIRVLHFSGNADGSVPTEGTRSWINTLGWNITRPYRPFYTQDNQVGGFVVEYEGLTFTSIQGIGHMAAQWAPEVTKHAVYRFINNQHIDDDNDSEGHLDHFMKTKSL